MNAPTTPKKDKSSKDYSEKTPWNLKSVLGKRNAKVHNCFKEGAVKKDSQPWPAFTFLDPNSSPSCSHSLLKYFFDVCVCLCTCACAHTETQLWNHLCMEIRGQLWKWVSSSPNSCCLAFFFFFFNLGIVQILP